MSPQAPLRWPVIQAAFGACTEGSLTERPEIIAQAGLTSAERAELDSLLAHHDALPSQQDFLAQDASHWLATPATRIGQRMGNWEIVAELGSGGMGEVFEARRADGSFEGRAAIKLLKRGMDSAAVLQRFAQERQALARLNHPHIARLLDAGASPEGLPYFVLEYVPGKPIDQAALGAPLEQRLALFLQLADAVSHAHRHLLVHRDLKPGNVLVTDDGQVKLLDFGIAKALDPLEHHRAADTLVAERPFTPHYASPEQVRGEPVSTATDIYSLGVLLYVMLTGQRPYGRSASTAQEAARSVLEEMPTRPSALSPQPGAVDTQWLATRKRLRGDLDNILLKALAKGVEERYPSVEAMAQDVRAFLAGQPVSAHPPSAGYLAWKFLQRHRLGSALAGVGLVAVLGFAGIAWQQKQQAEARFADLRELAHAVLFDYHDLIEPLAGATPVRKRLVQDAITYLDKLSQAAPQDRTLRREMGMAYRTVGHVQRNGFRRPHLGDTAGAMRSYARGVELLEALHAEAEADDESAYELALVLSARAGVQSEDGQLGPAREQLARAAALFARYVPNDRPDHRHRLELARTHLRLADAMNFNGDAAGSAAFTEKARQVLNSLAALAPEHKEPPHVWVWVHNRASALARARGDWATVVREETTSRGRLLALAAVEPDNARYQEDLAGAAQWLMVGHAGLRDAAALQHWEAEAMERWTGLTRRDPQDRTAGGKLIDTCIDAALAHADVANPAVAQERLQRARIFLAEASQRWPGEQALERRRLKLRQAEQRLAAAQVR